MSNVNLEMTRRHSTRLDARARTNLPMPRLIHPCYPRTDGQESSPADWRPAATYNQLRRCELLQFADGTSTLYVDGEKRAVYALPARTG